MSETDNFKSHEEIEIKTEDNLVNEKDVIYRPSAIEAWNRRMSDGS